MARGQAQLRGTCAGCGGQRERLELERTDVEALTDVSGTDARFAQACAAVWTCTRVSLCTQWSAQPICTVKVLCFLCVRYDVDKLMT